MIELLRMLAIPCFIVAPFAGWMAFAFFREGERRSGWRAAGVFAVTASVLFVAYTELPSPTYSDRECRVDWDGFSNAEVC